MPFKHLSSTDPHATINNATHTRLRRRLASLQNSVTLTSKIDGHTLKFSSSDPAAVDRLGTYLTAASLNLTLGGACPVDIGDLYVNFECDKHTGSHSDPDWLTEILVNGCDFNTTSLTVAERDTLDHFCNDMPQQILLMQHEENALRIYFGGAAMLLLMLFCCAFILGRRGLGDDPQRERRPFYHDRRGNYLPVEVMDPRLQEFVRVSHADISAEEKKELEDSEDHDHGYTLMGGPQ